MAYPRARADAVSTQQPTGPTTMDATPDRRRTFRLRRLRAEAVAVAELATPVVLVQLGMMLMGTVDTMMLGRFSELALAAGALGNSFSFGLVSLPMGILMALDPLVAQAHGAGDRPAVAASFKRGLVLAVLLAVPICAIAFEARPILQLLGQKPAVLAEATLYLRASIPGLLAFLLFVTVRQTLQAMSIVRPAMVAIIAANLVNVAANYGLIFGHFGLPRLGVEGSGYATSLSRWVMLAVLVLGARPILGPIWPARRLRRLRLRGYLQMLIIGLPIGVQISLEMWLFNGVAFLMGNLGARELAAHQIALSLAALSFMVPLGISGAAATRVGNAIGRGSPAAARRAAVVCLVLGAAVMTVSALAFWFLPVPLSRLFTDQMPVIALAATLVPIAALFQVFDGLQVVGAGVLRGAGDTRVPAIIALVGYWLLALPVAWLLAFRAGHGPQGLWWGLTAGLSTVAILFLIRIARTFRRDLRALERADD